jgi:leader peptidase (prepilin peptidase) / N-methyltransferase
VYGLRLLSEESPVLPPSHCPSCKTPLKWFDNIPVLSWLLLRGKCRTCPAPISIQYPLVELATAWLFLGIGSITGITGLTLLLFFLVANLVVITITDWHESLIFEINSMPLIPAGILTTLLYPGVLTHMQFLMLPDWQLGPITISSSVLSCLLGILVPLLFFEGTILVSKWLFKTEGFGHGDTHLMMGVGAFLGAELTVLSLVLGFIIQAVWAIPLLVIRWCKERAYLSMGSGVGALGFCAFPLLPFNNSLAPDAQLTISFVAIGLSLVCLFVFLRQLRQQTEYTYVPLGPALVAGSLISLFYKLTGLT